MEAMVFAAGIGSRLRPFTLSHPKALAPVAGIPALQRCIEYLRDNASVSHTVINIHHFPEQVRNFIEAHSKFGIEISFADESDLLLDTGGGLLAAKSLFHKEDDMLLLHNADIVTDFPVKEMAECFISSGADAVLLVDQERESSRSLWFSTDGRLQGWTNNKTGAALPPEFSPDSRICHPASFNGVHIIRPSTIFPLLRKYSLSAGAVFSMTPFYLQAISLGADIRAFSPAAPYRWHDIGSPEKLAAATRDFSI